MEVLRVIGYLTDTGIEYRTMRWNGTDRKTTIKIRFEDSTTSRIIKKSDFLVANTKEDFSFNRITSMVWCLPKDKDIAIEIIIKSLKSELNNMYSKIENLSKTYDSLRIVYENFLKSAYINYEVEDE